MKKTLLLLLLLMPALLRPVYAQHPPWYFINTVHNHIVLVLNTIPIMIDTVPIVPGDYIGAFYTFNSVPVCGSGTGVTGDVGGMMYTGDVNAVTIWGADPNVFNGFQTGEEFNWKIWRASDGSIFDAIATYDIITLPDSGLYVDEGLSKLSSLLAIGIPGVNLSVNSQSWPESGCEYLESQPVTVVVQNHDTLDVFGFNIYYAVNNGDTITEFVNDTIAPGDFLEYSFNTLMDLSQVGSYSFYVWVDFPGDVNNTNDYNSKDIVILDSPIVSIGDDMAICEGDTIVIQTDDFFSEYLWNEGSPYQYIYASEEGYYSVTITDDIGCNGVDSLYLTVYPEPEIDLIDSIYFCEGGYTNVALVERFRSIQWSNGLLKPNLYITYPGTYWVTVTDFVGCTTRDFLLAIEIPLPEINLGDTIFTLFPESVQIDAGSGFDEYLWSTGDTTSIMWPGTFGAFGITVTNSGCEGYDEIFVVQKDTTTVHVVNELLLFPNPVQDDLRIDFPYAESINVSIYNALGQFVYGREFFNRFSIKLDVDLLEMGVYIVYVEADTEVYSRRFIISY